MTTALRVVFELEGVWSQSLQQVTATAACTVISGKKKHAGEEKPSPGWLKGTSLSKQRKELPDTQVYLL